MRVWTHKGVEEDRWQRPDDAGRPGAGRVLESAERLEALLAEPACADRGLAVLLGGDDDPAAVAGAFDRLTLIAVEFPSATDGRGYSLARELRRLGYRGELRAVGHVRRDQAFYLQRCGFDAFELEDGVDAADFARGFEDFTGVYQRAADDRVPIARRRPHG